MRTMFMLSSVLALSYVAATVDIRAQPAPARVQGAADPATKSTEATKRQTKGAIRKRQRSAGALANARTDGDREITDPNFTPADLAHKHAPQQKWYLRRDPIDLSAFYYLYPTQPLDTKGASLSYTDDLLNRTRAATIQAFLAYALPPYFETNDRAKDGPLALSAMVVAPYLWLNGTLTDPRKASERSALQAGIDAQFEFWRGGLFALQDLGVRPYLQTDFRGEGQIVGVQALWEPYQERWNLGARYDMRVPKLVGLLWRVIGEFNAIYVDRPGLSDFTAHTSYAWLGGTLQVKAVLFENYASVPDWLCGRIVLNGSTNYFWDGRSGRSINDNEASIGYSFARSSSNVLCSGNNAHEPRLKPAVSFVYNNGTDKSTLEKREQYKVVLSVQF
jgi:hypothetical protein